MTGSSPCENPHLLGHLSSDGTLDTSFGDDGWLRFGVAGFEPHSVVIDRAGRVLVDGTSGRNRSPAVVRLEKDGSRDPAFGRRGLVLLPPHWNVVGESAIAVEPSGRILVAATTSVARPFHETPRDGLVLGRLKADGGLDPGFGRGGAVTVYFGRRLQADFGALLLPEPGRAVLVGSAQAEIFEKFAGVGLAAFRLGAG